MEGVLGEEGILRVLLLRKVHRRRTGTVVEDEAPGGGAALLNSGDDVQRGALTTASGAEQAKLEGGSIAVVVRQDHRAAVEEDKLRPLGGIVADDVDG